MTKRIVVALGGNALTKKGEKISIKNQLKHIDNAVNDIVTLAKQGHELVITHGNGPQVGNILIRVEEALGKAYNLPLEVCVAESEGELGYLIEQTLQNKLMQQHIKRPVVSLLTQVIVDKKDPHFKKPTKPVGPFYTKAQALRLQKKGLKMINDAGRGWRRVVPSPRPVKIDDVNIIATLMKKKVIVIAAGGGGIPVVKERGKLRGVAAVVDKDWASVCLAQAVKADTLLILTGVKKVALNFGTKKQVLLKTISVKEAQKYMKEGHFAEGSMLPKIAAAVDFIKKGGKEVIITCPSCVKNALQGREGTRITK